MGNEKEIRQSFLKGLGIGALAAALAIIITLTGINVFARQTRWGGIDPNTKLMEIYGLLNRYSIVPFEKDEMLDNMYRGFLAGVNDPYTQYLCVDALAAFHSRADGVFVGIGVTIFVDNDDPFVTISDVFRGAPAEAAGILPGDQIMAVDGTDVAGWQREDVVGRITGPANTPVVLTVYRPYESKRFDVEIIRARVEIPSVFHEMLYTENGLIGYIRLDGFDRVTPGQFDAAVAELAAEGMSGLILDVRNNPGGMLHSVVNITDRLIPEGVIVFTVDSRGRREYTNTRTAEHLGIPLVLLVNGRSASASEVLAGAIRDTGVGTIVGEQTFGKGVVQNLLNLSDGSAIKLTVQTYHSPSGENIHGIGITPDIIVEMSDELGRRISSITLEEDIQLQVAIEVIGAKF